MAAGTVKPQEKLRSLDDRFRGGPLPDDRVEGAGRA